VTGQADRLALAGIERPGDYPGDPAAAELLRRKQELEQGWEVPVPLEGPPPPAFPVEVLPGVLGKMVFAVTTEQQVPTDLPALLALGIVSVAVGGRAEVQVQDGWREPVLLWVACVLPPGQQKSPTLRRLRLPLDKAERRLHETTAKQVATRWAEREIAEKRARKLAEKAAASTDPAVEVEALEARCHLEGLEEMYPPRLTAGDVTPEALTRMLAEQQGRLGLVDAEGGAFGTIAGRYNSGTPKIDEVNKGYDLDAIKVDRVGRPTLLVDRPAVTLVLTVQPDVIREAGAQPALRERGLLDRFTYAVPVPTVGTGRELRPPVVPDEVAAGWAVLVDELVGLTADGEEPVVLGLSEEAWRLHTEWRRQLEPRLKTGVGDLAVIGGWANKHAGRVVRIAGLLHLAVHPRLDVLEIDAQTMRAALRIGNWAIPHALAAFDLAVARPDLEPARRLLRALCGNGKETFSERDAHRLVDRQSHFGKVAAVREALATLADFGWARLADDGAAEPTRPGRKPSPRWELHPRALRERGQNRHKPEAGHVLSVPSPFQAVL